MNWTKSNLKIYIIFIAQYYGIDYKNKCEK